MIHQQNSFVGFEYLEVPAKRSMESLYADSYGNFGWEFEGAIPQAEGSDSVLLKFKRDRKLRNKAELTRLQHQFEACAREIERLEHSRTTAASVAAFSLGLVGCAFLGGAVFAYLHGLFLPMVILAVPGFVGWILPYFLYRAGVRRQTEKITPLIEEKYDEIYEICEKGNKLLN